MKKVMVFALVLLYMNATAQESQPSKLPKLPKKEGVLIVSFNLDNYLDLDKAVKVKAGYSRGFSMLFMNQLNFGKSNISVAFGLGLTSHNVHSNSILAYNADKSQTYFLPLDDSINYDKNKLVTNFFDQAIELRFKTSPNLKQKSFFIHAGFRIAELIQSHTKIKNDTGKTKIYKIANLTKFQYGPTARIGYGNLAISGFYSLTKLFKDGNDLVVTPVSLGLSLVF